MHGTYHVDGWEGLTNGTKAATRWDFREAGGEGGEEAHTQSASTMGMEATQRNATRRNAHHRRVTIEWSNGVAWCQRRLVGLCPHSAQEPVHKGALRDKAQIVKVQA